MNKAKVNKNIILLLFVLVTVIWGAGFPLLKIALDNGFPQFFMLASRFSIAAIFLIIVRVATKKNFHFTTPEIKNGAILGVLLFAGLAFQCFGLAHTTPAKNGLITVSYVIIVPLLLFIMTKRFTLKPLVDAAICLFGMMIFFNIFEGFTDITIGDGLSLICAVIFAIHIVFLQKYSRSCNILDLTIFQMIACALLSIIAFLIFELKGFNVTNWPFMVVIMLYFGIFSTALAFLIQSIAQKHFSATTVSMVACLEGVFGVSISIMLGMEVVTYTLIFGALFIIFSILRSVLMPPAVFDKFL